MFRRKNSKISRIISWNTVAVLVLTSILALLPVGILNNNVVVEAAAMSTTRTSVHDPSIVKANGQYYIFGSHLAFSKSSDLTNWSSVTTNVNTNYASIFSSNATWSALGGTQGNSSYKIDGNLWAPDVIYNSTMGKWCMYMSINGDYYYSSIALATADNIEGPYTYAGTVVYSGFDNASQAAMTDYAKVTGTNNVASRYLSNGSWNPQYAPNAIDPCVLYDANGDLWMAYGSWFGGIFMLKLDKNTGLRDYSYTYSTSTNSSDQYLGKKLAGGYGCTGEGSYIVYDSSAGYYYMYLSYGGLNATDSFSNYNMRLFRSKSITGPYTDASGNSAICTSSSTDQTKLGVKLMGNYYFSSLANASSSEISQNGYKSPGHNSAFIDSNGQRYLVYHTRFNQGNEWHQVRVHQQFVNQDGWLVTAPYEYLGSTISNNYSTSDIVGTYEFVNHGNTAAAMYADMLPTSVVSLNSDGTITGAYSGTWSRTSGTYYCTMVIGGVTYKGVFFKQYDESASHNEVMTFSLIGSNNQAIWGSKTSNATSGGSGSSASGLDGIYYIKNVHSGLYLDVTNGSSADGTNIQQWAYNGYDSQKFKLVSDGNGYYSILTGASGYASSIDIYNGESTDGANVEQWTYWGGDMQKFEIVQVSSGKYAIKSKCSGSNSCLDVYNWSTESGGNIAQWTYWGGDCQLWYLEAASSSGSSSSGSSSSDSLEGTYFIKNVHSGLYLDVTNGSADNNANIQQWAYNGYDAQKFKIVSDGDGYYHILTGASGYSKCVDVAGGKAADGTNILQYTYKGSSNQQFKIELQSDGTYAILTRASNCVGGLDVYGWSTESGGNVNQWEYWGGNCQKWILEAA
ncbi:MAG: glycoside hydrolase family 43 protein [Lachnospiraceae bacterium]|nr:glycoside hydrolase family 43 protein [Lachnospiraceae bacterium]